MEAERGTHIPPPGLPIFGDKSLFRGAVNNYAYSNYPSSTATPTLPVHIMNPSILSSSHIVQTTPWYDYQYPLMSLSNMSSTVGFATSYPTGPTRNSVDTQPSTKKFRNSPESVSKNPFNNRPPLPSKSVFVDEMKSLEYVSPSCTQLQSGAFQYSTINEDRYNLAKQTNQNDNLFGEPRFSRPSEIVTSSLLVEESKESCSTVNKGVKEAEPCISQKVNWSCDTCNYKANTEEDLKDHVASKSHNCNLMVKLNKNHALQLLAFKQAQLHPIFQLPDEAAMVKVKECQKMETVCGMIYEQLCSMATSEEQHGQKSVNLGQDTVSSEQTPDDSCYSTTFEKELEELAGKTDIIPYDDSAKLYQCCVCMVFSSYTLMDLAMHTHADRSTSNNDEKWAVMNENKRCTLCGYSTDKTSSFRAHCRSRIHLRRLRYYCHVKEGGNKTSWRLKYIYDAKYVQLRCNACGYDTNCVDDLSNHSRNLAHISNSRLFFILEQRRDALTEQLRTYRCRICNMSVASKTNLIQHLNSVKHVKAIAISREQEKFELDFIEILPGEELQSVDEVNGEVLKTANDLKGGSLLDVQNFLTTNFEAENKVNGYAKSSETSLIKQILIGRTTLTNNTTVFTCPFCHFNSDIEIWVRMHVLKHSKILSSFNCPLCMLGFDMWDDLQLHISEFHHVDKVNFEQITALVGEKKWTSVNMNFSDNNFEENIDIPLEPIYPNLSKLRRLLEMPYKPRISKETVNSRKSEHSTNFDTPPDTQHMLGYKKSSDKTIWAIRTSKKRGKKPSDSFSIDCKRRNKENILTEVSPRGQEENKSNASPPGINCCYSSSEVSSQENTSEVGRKSSTDVQSLSSVGVSLSTTDIPSIVSEFPSSKLSPKLEQ